MKLTSLARFESEKEAHISICGFHSQKIRADGFFGMDSSLYTVAVPIVFDQEIHVHYGQFYVESRNTNDEEVSNVSLAATEPPPFEYNFSLGITLSA
jgi:hypothetical protein